MYVHKMLKAIKDTDLDYYFKWKKKIYRINLNLLSEKKNLRASQKEVSTLLEYIL